MSHGVVNFEGLWEGPRIYRPYLRRLESTTTCRCHSKGRTFSSVILRPWELIRLGFWIRNFQHSSPMLNQLSQSVGSERINVSSWCQCSRFQFNYFSCLNKTDHWKDSKVEQEACSKRNRVPLSVSETQVRQCANWLFPIDHFAAVCLVAWPLNESEAGVDLVLIETSLYFLY